MSAWLPVRIQPRARRAGLKGRLADGTLQLAVTAPPEDGRANRALIELLSDLLGIESRRIQLRRGGTSRSKLLEIEGLAQDELERRVTSALAEREGKRD